MTATLEAANEALRSAVQSRLDSTPADDPKMVGYERKTCSDSLQKSDTYPEWDTFTRQTGDGVMGERPIGSVEWLDAVE